MDKENKATQSNYHEKVKERRRMLEEYLKNKSEKKSAKCSKPALGKRSISSTKVSEESQNPNKKVAIESGNENKSGEQIQAKVIINWDKPVYIEKTTENEQCKFCLIKKPVRPSYPVSVFEYLLINNHEAIATAMKILACRQSLPPKIKECYAKKLGDLFEKYGGKVMTESKLSSSPSPPTTPLFDRQVSKMSIDSVSEKMPSLSYLRTPTSGEEERRMGQEIEEIIKRTPVLRDQTAPSRTRSIQLAASLIKSVNYLDLCLHSPQKTKSKEQSRELDEKKGSSLFYALVTPKKKVQELMGSSSVVSPVRRSLRIIEKTGSGKNLFENLADIPDLSERGYLPNPNISDSTRNSPFKRTKHEPKNNEQAFEAVKNCLHQKRVIICL